MCKRLKKTRSVHKSLMWNFIILLFTTLACLVSYGLYSIWMYEQQLIFTNQAALDVYANNLIYELQDLTSVNQDIYSSDTDFRLLSSKADSLSDKEKIVPEYNLRMHIQNRIPNTGAIFIFNQSRSVYFYHFRSGFLGGTTTPQLMEFMNQIRQQCLDLQQGDLMRWKAFLQDETVLLLNTYRLQDLYVCSILDLNAFIGKHTQGIDSIEYVFFTNEQILTNKEYADREGITVGDIKNAVLQQRKGLYEGLYVSNIIQADYYPDLGVGLSGIMSLHGIWGYTRNSIILFFAAIIIICALFFVIYTFINRILIFPLNQITRASQLLEGSTEIIPQEQEDLQEFSTIRIALNQLMQQKIQLEKENTSQTQEKEHALLQYYQLQTRSHFLLNCLKSLYNMSEKSESDKMKTMIVAFSNHIRYVFHDNLLLVTLKAELNEVQDYYRIILMDRAFPLLLNLEVEETLTDCRVPPLIVQTFLENTYKYNADNNKILRFSVHIDRIELDNKLYIRIRLTDNGVGYSNEVLNMLSTPDEQFEQYHIGISNLKRRISLIYHNDFQIAFFNAPDGGACSLIYLPLQR